LLWGFLWGGWKKNFVPINDLKDYVGEKQAFYVAWLIHYTGWLLVPLVGGIILLAIQVSNY
jgi:Calcium-activated chloride channel